ncbi:hypothetical protein XENOCAPTIV_022234 [Xenoophorus captivus]|uniref:Uncharacterized protein n=1 Tax=Xenoophorus captivus TaxID=1517983 RepID=A0ABV0RII9_9TELE
MNELSYCEPRGSWTRTGTGTDLNTSICINILILAGKKTSAGLMSQPVEGNRDLQDLENIQRTELGSFLEGVCPILLGLNVKHGGGSVMLWGCLVASGPGGLAGIDGTMNSAL